MSIVNFFKNLFSSKAATPPVSLPAQITKQDVINKLLEISQTQVGVRESGGYNKGPMVEQYQKVIGIAEQESWCMSYQQWLSYKACNYFGIKNVLYPSEGCVEVADHTPSKYKIMIGMAKFIYAGTLSIWRHAGGWTGHCGQNTSRVDANGEYHTNEGNTDGSGGREGDGVYNRIRNIDQHDPYLYAVIDLPQMIFDRINGLY